MRGSGRPKIRSTPNNSINPFEVDCRLGWGGVFENGFRCWRRSLGDHRLGDDGRNAECGGSRLPGRLRAFGVETKGVRETLFSAGKRRDAFMRGHGEIQGNEGRGQRGGFSGLRTTVDRFAPNFKVEWSSRNARWRADTISSSTMELRLGIGIDRKAIFWQRKASTAKAVW